MNKRILTSLYYITLAEIAVSIYLSIHDLNNDGLGLGALTFAVVDAIIAIYYMALALIIRRFIKSNNSKLPLVILLNLIPIVFYLYLLDIF